MTTDTCARTAATLTRYLTEGGELDSALLEHLAHCAPCGETLRRAQMLGDLLQQDDDAAGPATANPSGAVSGEVVAAVRRRRWLRIFLAAAIVVIGVGAWYATALPTGYVLRHRWGVWGMLVILLAGPLLLVAISAGLDAGPSRFYKRLRGRELSGVCRGLAESLAVPVWILRAAFVALLFLNGAGVILYLLLDVLMPIHPSDRKDLLRFRVRRWWQQRRMAMREGRP